jgi:hypothetical protein
MPKPPFDRFFHCPFMPPRFVALLFAIHAAATFAQTLGKSPASPCPAVADMKAEQLFGTWSAQFTNPPAGLPKQARLQLQRHAEFTDSLEGSVSRSMPFRDTKPDGHAPTAALAGDLEEGLLLLDESSDRVSITGTWNAEMVAGSCGKAFRGVWKDTSRSASPDAPEVPFSLTKLP